MAEPFSFWGGSPLRRDDKETGAAGYHAAGKVEKGEGWLEESVSENKGTENRIFRSRVQMP